MKKKISVTIEEKIIRDIDTIIDNVYIRNRSQAIEHLVSHALGENKVAVILAGGPEKSLTLENGQLCMTSSLQGRAVIEHAIRKLRENNFKSIFVVAQQSVLTKIFNILKDGAEYGVAVQYIEEKRSTGTADTLRLLKGKITGNFLVVYADIVFSKIRIEALWKDHLTHSAITTLLMSTSPRPHQKGALAVEGNRILQFRQKPSSSEMYLVFAPIFAASPELFSYPGPSLEEDVFPALAEKGLLIGHLSSEREIHIHSVKDLKKAQ